MKNSFFILAMAIGLAACTDRKFETYTANVPVYMSYEELRTSFTVTAGREVKQPGKIYFLPPYLFINEYREGIHVVDVSDPTRMQTVAFMDIPGNVDMAVRNGILYADSYVDLVMIDISVPESPTEAGRLEEILDYVIPPDDTDYPLADIDEEKGVVVEFVIDEFTREIHHRPHPWPVFYEYDMLSSAMPVKAGSAGGNAIGVAGSMARFLTHEDFLYILDNTYMLKSFELEVEGQPELRSKQYLNGNVETLFIADNFLYVGTSGGMHIMDLQEPSAPALLSTYWHVTACDPVVVSGNRAYVTLRAGNNCGGDQNLLEVVDISDKSDPRRVASHAMTEPYGLGIDGQVLFICEGEHGLKIFDATDPLRIPQRKLAQFGDIHALDVIPLNKHLYTIGDKGLSIYDYSDLQDIRLLGNLPVGESSE
jgi:hypothetical protein